MSDPGIIEITLDGPVVEVEVPGIQGPAGDPLDFDGQIPFPATQNASADANTLDDYEEGTFTPVFFAAGVSGVTYSAQVGIYTKIGDTVHFAIDLRLTSKGTGGSGGVALTGLPFAPANLIVFVAAIRVSNVTFPAGYTAPVALPQPAAATINLGLNGSGVAAANMQWSDATDTSQYRITGSYKV